MKKETRKTTSIKINPSLWRYFKIYCLKKKIEMSDKLEELIRGVLKK